MFYCEECAKKNEWPSDFFLPLSHGTCEVCGKGGKTCFDVPSSQLPPAKEDPNEYQLNCPQCHHGDELRIIETTQFERHAPDVTTHHTEYGDEATEPTYNEIGVCCNRCGFRHIGDNWKAVLKKGEKLDDEHSDPA